MKRNEGVADLIEQTGREEAEFIAVGSLFIGPLDRSPIGVVFIACALRGRVPIAALCISIFFRVRRATGNCPNDLLLGLVRFVHHFRALVRTRRPVQARVLPWTLLLRVTVKNLGV